MPATRAARPRSGAPDASMSLLNELLQRPLDPGYAAAAKRREGAGESAPHWGRSPLVVIAAVVLGLTFALSALTLRTPPGAAAQDRAALLERIEARRDAVDAKEAAVAGVQEQIAGLEAGGPDATTVQSVRVAEAAGVVAVHGPGVVITLDDAPTGPAAAPGGDPRNTQNAPGRIVARDLQAVTNALWAAGAEAIAVNGHRLTSTSSIRFAGAAILVGYRPLTRPYTVSAIAGPDAVTRFETGDGGAYLAELRSAYQARADLSRSDDVRLPAGSVLDLRVATPVAPRTPTPSPTASTSTGATS